MKWNSRHYLVNLRIAIGNRVLEAVNYYRKVLNLGWCSNPRSASGNSVGKSYSIHIYFTDSIGVFSSFNILSKTFNDFCFYSWVRDNYPYFWHHLFHDGGPYHIENSPFICRANQCTDFFMIGTSITKELRKLHNQNILYFLFFLRKDNFSQVCVLVRSFLGR